MAGEKSDFETTDRWLLLLMLTPPSVWLTHLSVSYALVPQSCVWSSKALLHMLTVIAFLITASSAFMSWRELGRIGAEGSMSHPHEPRRRFMAVLGVVFGIVFTMLVVANQIPNFILRSCD